MGFFKDHQHTAITEIVQKCVADSNSEYDLEEYLPHLISLIRDDADTKYVYVNNQLECGRSIRKFLKYGNQKKQYMALKLLNLIVMQDLRFMEMFNDSKLLDRLTCIALGTGVDSSNAAYDLNIVKLTRKCIMNWCNNRSFEDKCYKGFFTILNKLKNKNTNGTRGSRNGLQFLNDSADSSFHPNTINSNNPDDRYGIPIIDMSKEAPKIRLLISDAINSSVALKNSLQMLPQGRSSTEDEQATKFFVEARNIRRKVLRYLQLVTSGEFLGSLLNANDQIVEALTKYDELAVDEDDSSNYYRDSDSEYETQKASPPPPPQQQQQQYTTRADFDDPFGDDNRI